MKKVHFFILITIVCLGLGSCAAKYSKISESKTLNSVFVNSAATKSTIENSTLEDSAVEGSKVIKSKISGLSKISNNSTIENSTIEKNPKIENIQKIQNLSVNDANQFTVDRIKVEFERGTSEADKAALRLAFSQDLDIQVFHWYTCSSDPNTEIWEFIPIAQPLAIQKAQDLEDEDDIKRAVIQVSCD